MNMFPLSAAALTLLAAAGAFAAPEVWNADRTLTEPVAVRRMGLKIEPGIRVSFTGRGSLLVEDGPLTCRRVSFEADGVLTNAFRVEVRNGMADLEDCEFRSVRAVAPAGEKQHWISGGVCVNGGRGSKIVHCTFKDSSAVMLMNAHGSEISRNLVVGGDMGFSFLQCRNVRIDANEFWGVTDIALKVGSGVSDSELFMNRFTRCGTGVRLQYCSDTRLSGNAFFDCTTGITLWECGKGIVQNGNRFEGVKTERREKVK